MSTFERTLLYAAMVISVIMLLLGLAGVIGAWTINTPVTESILAVLAPINAALLRVEGISAETVAALTQVSDALEAAGQRVQELGSQVTETNILVAAVSEIVGEDVQPKLDEAGDNIRAVYDTLAAIEEAMQSFNAIPFVAVDAPGSEEITRLRTGMEETAVTLRDFRQELQQQKAEAVAEAVDRVTQPINRMNTSVGEIQGEVSDVEARAGAASDRLTNLQSQVPRWVDIVSIVITLILAWFMLSQVAVLVLCLKYLQGKVS